jgi:hypothetical protein
MVGLHPDRRSEQLTRQLQEGELKMERERPDAVAGSPRWTTTTRSGADSFEIKRIDESARCSTVSTLAWSGRSRSTRRPSRPPVGSESRAPIGPLVRAEE